MLVTTSDGRRLWWQQEGEGPAVLLVPGRGDSSDLFPRMFTTALGAAGMSTIRFDPRDTGLSDDGGSTYTLSTMADDAVAVADAAGADRVTAVGVSMGGLTLVDLATRFPERVGALGFISAMSPDPDAGIGEDFFAALEGDALRNTVAAMGATTPTDEAWAAAELEAARVRAPVRPDAVHRHQEAAFRLGWPAAEDLTRITAPTTVVHGELDRVLPITHGRALAHGIGTASLTVLPDMGHLPRPNDWSTIADLVVAVAGLPRSRTSRRAITADIGLSRRHRSDGAGTMARGAHDEGGMSPNVHA